MRRAVGLALAIGLFASVREGRAADGAREAASAVLAYENASAEASCPNERDFRDRVAARLGFDPFVTEAERTVRVTLTDDAARRRVRAVVLLRSTGQANGRRELDAARAECTELGDSIAVAVSLFLDPLGKAAAAATAAPPAPAPAPAPVAPPPVAAAPAPVVPPPAPPSLVLGLEAAPRVSIGSAPGAGFGARVGAFARRGAWSLGLEAMIESTAGAMDVRAGERASLLTFAGGATACHRRPFFLGCAIASIGFAQGELEGRSGVRRSVASFAGVRLGVPLCARGDVCFVPFVDGLANVVRPRIRADAADLWTAPVASAVLGVALSLSP